MKSSEIVYVKVRLDTELHKKLKAKAQLEERSMNYLLNKAVELLVSKAQGGVRYECNYSSRRPNSCS